VTTLLPFHFHQDEREYLAALRSYRPGGEVPVLGAPGEEQEAVAALTCTERVRPADVYDEVVVAWSAGSRAAAVARALAVSVGGRAKELADPRELGASSGDARYVAVVGLAEEIDERSLMFMHDSLWEHRSTGQGGHLGVLVGADLEDLSWLIAKGLALAHRAVPDEEHLRLWPAVQQTALRCGSGRWVLLDEAVASTVRPLVLDTHTSVVSVLAHGRDDVLHLNDTVICPIGPVVIDPDDPAASHAPVCAFTGQCYRPEVRGQDIIRSGRIRADAVFANSCMGMRISQGLYPTDYLLPNGFIRGIAAAYLSTGQVINGLLKLNDIFHTACGSGRSVGEAATLINDHLRYERVDLPYYTLVGLPWLTVAMHQLDEEAWRSYLLARGECHEGGSVRAAAVVLAAEEATGASAHVLYASPRSEAVLGGAVTEHLDLATVPALKVALQTIGRSMTNLDDVPFTGLKYSRQGNMLVNVREQVAALARSLNVAALRGDAGKIGRKIKAIATGVERAELALAEAVFERGVQSFQHYNDVWGETLEMHPPVLTDEECPYCSRLLVQQRATHPVITRIARDARVCPRCGMIRDTDASSPIEQMLVETPELWNCGQTAAIGLRLRLRDGDARPSKVAVGVFMANAAKNGMSFPPPRIVPIGADGGARADVELLVPDEARMHQEYIRGLVVAEGTISFVTRPVWVRPALPVLRPSREEGVHVGR
jgi:hypothetical protein